MAVNWSPEILAALERYTNESLLRQIRADQLRGARPDFVVVDDIDPTDEVRWQVGVNADPAVTRPTFEPIGTVSGSITYEELRDDPSPIDAVRAAYTRLAVALPDGFTYRELCGCSWCQRVREESPPSPEQEARQAEQEWQSQVNARVAADRELARERDQAYWRAMAAESELTEWEEEHEDYVNVVLDRIVRGGKIPERPASLSWLYGPSGGEGE